MLTTDDSRINKLAIEAKTGDLNATEELARSLHDPLFALLHLRGIPEKDIEDMAQNVMFQIYRHLSSYDPERPFMPWFRTITRNLTANYWAKHARKKNRFSEFRDYVATFDTEIDERCDALEQRKSRLTECIKKLKQKQQNLIKLYYYKRYDSKRIAEEGVNEESG